MIRKFSKKIFIFLIIGLSFIFCFQFNTKIYAAESSENKIYCEATLDDAFSTDRVLIVLNEEASSDLKTYDENDFVAIKCGGVSDLTDYAITNILTSGNTDVDYKRVLSLELEESSKEYVLEAIDELMKRDDVLYAGPDYEISIASTTPNDYNSTDQWAIDALDLPEAWDFTTGSKEVIVGIMDTGIDGTHPDLKDSIINNMCRDFTTGKEVAVSTPTDPHGHGTSVAGIIGAIGNNSKGVVGVNWNVSLVSLRVFNSNGSGYSSYVAEAIKYAQKNDIDILNLSAGWYSNNSRYDLALDEIIKTYSGLIVCAAGNEGRNNDGSNPIYPASYRLDNIISVGAHDKNNNRSVWSSGSSNYGEKTVDIYAPGGKGVKQNNDNCYTTGVTESGYTYFNGTSCASPHVAGVAALLLSINENLTIAQVKESILESAIPLTINIGGSSTQEVLKLNAFNAVKYVLNNFSNTTYNLGNYGSIDDKKDILNSDTYFDDLNGFYKLSVTYTKSYEFIASSASGIKVTLYDDDLTEISYNDLDSTSNKVHFIQNLSIGTYYLRVSFASASSTGTINTKIISRNTAYLSEGENDILINTYNNDDEYNFINHNGPGFYKFSIESTKADGSIVTYPYSSLKIYDHMNSSQEDKYNVDGYSELAQSIDNNNYLYMYLERNGYYYIHVNMPDASYTSVKLNIERVSVDEIEVASRFDEAFTETLINSNDMTEYTTGFSIDQTSVFTIDVTTSQTYTGNITFILFRKAYNNDTKEYYIDEVVGDYIPLESDELRKILVEGTYYIGFFGNTSNVPVTIKINRIVTTSEITDQVLVMDIDENLPYGTEVRHNGGEYGEKTITEGFTRHVHFQNVTGVPSVSRYDYSFYSSNKNYATVSEFGTVFAKSVTGNKTVTITAVYKYDPAIIFTIELTILDDTSNTEKIIETTQEISLSKFVNGKYKLVLDENNSPYPWIQYYNWSVFVPCQADDIAVTIDNYGFLTTTGAGSATLTGTYSINPNVTVIIHINFVE